MSENEGAVSGKALFRVLSTDGADYESKRWYIANRSTHVQLREIIEEAKKKGMSLKEIYWMLATDNPFNNNFIKMQIGKTFCCY